MIRTALLSFLLTGIHFSLTAAGPGEKLIETDGYLLVHSQVNGRGPFLFLLDTGATSSTLTPTVARAIGLVPRSSVTVATLTGEIKVPTVDVKLQVGSTAALVSEALIMPLDQPKKIDRRIEGVLGQSFLAQAPCLIDYRGHRLWLGEKAVERSRALPEKLNANRLDGRLALLVALDAGSSPLRLVLDSGTPDLILSCGNHCPNLAATSEGGLATNGGARKMVRGMLDSISVGAIRIRRPTAVLLDNESSTPGEDGLLPTRWFSAIYLGPANTVALAR